MIVEYCRLVESKVRLLQSEFRLMVAGAFPIVLLKGFIAVPEPVLMQNSVYTEQKRVETVRTMASPYCTFFYSI